MAKTRKVEKFAVVMSNGSKHDVENALVKKYHLKPGNVTPFSRAATTVVVRTEEQKAGPKDWTVEEDTYLMEHWDTVTKTELARRLDVSPATLTKRHKELQAKAKAEQRAAAKSRKKATPRRKKAR